MRILIIQTAFIGDVVLATPLIENLKKEFPDCEIDFMLRKGNEALLAGHPHIHKLLVFEKKQNKYGNLWRIIRQVRSRKYDLLINVQRFFTTGLITLFSGAKERIGFDKNPISFAFTRRIPHIIGGDSEWHEVDRNLRLIAHLVTAPIRRPVLYPSDMDEKLVKEEKPYICLAPGSVWFTKKYPVTRWVELADKIPVEFAIRLVGGPDDRETCEYILAHSKHPDVQNTAGQLNMLQSVALIKHAQMTFSNDSAPLHFASAVNAPVTAIYCSTIHTFGFGPLSEISYTVQTELELECRPCGLHGKNACPLGHFNCSNISAEKILAKAGLITSL